jgi:hypothetical protein
MSNGKSRRKGVTGEQHIAKSLGGKRVGIAFLNNPVDVETDFAKYQVRNRNQSGNKLLDLLKAMPDDENNFVAFKPSRGEWLVVETLRQHQEHHY